MSADAVQSFYARIAPVFDRVARYFPGVGAARASAVDALDLAPGDTVLDAGCGTGANAPYLREQVGDAGRVVGLDLTLALLRRARERGVAPVRGDAADPPIAGSVDGVLATFVVGMLEDPEAAVDAWIDRLDADGRVVVLEATPSDRRIGRLLDPAFRLFVRVGAPGGRGDESPAAVLDRRVERAESALRERATVETETRLGGFLTVLVADPGS